MLHLIHKKTVVKDMGDFYMDTTLYKSKTDRVLTGVCGGIAEYFGFDPLVLRIIFVISFGAALWVYIALAILMQERKF